MGGVYISKLLLSTKEPPDQTAFFARRKAAGRIRRQGRRSQTRTPAHTAVARRRLAMAMVGPLVMGAGHKAGSPFGQGKMRKAAPFPARPPITVKSAPPIRGRGSAFQYQFDSPMRRSRLSQKLSPAFSPAKRARACGSPARAALRYHSI